MTYRVADVARHIDPERLLVVELAGSKTPCIAVDVRYVPAVDAAGRRAVAIELAYDSAGGTPDAPYYCPADRLVRRLVAPASVRRIRPYR